MQRHKVQSLLWKTQTWKQSWRHGDYGLMLHTYFCHCMLEILWELRDGNDNTLPVPYAKEQTHTQPKHANELAACWEPGRPSPRPLWPNPALKPLPAPRREPSSAFLCLPLLSDSAFVGTDAHKRLPRPRSAPRISSVEGIQKWGKHRRSIFSVHWGTRQKN